MLPSGWKRFALRDVADVITGSTPSTNDQSLYGSDYPFVSPSDLGSKKWVMKAQRHLSEEGFRRARRVPAGSILFTCIGATIGKIGMTGVALATNQQINAVIPRSVNGEYLYYALDRISMRIRRRAGIQALPIVNKSSFENEIIQIPLDLMEQQKIAGILGSWDESIEKVEQLIEAKERRKYALSQHLLFGKRNLQGREGQWKEMCLQEVTKELKSRNNDELGSDAVMAVNKFQGLIPMREHVMASSLERYKVVPPKAFAYNPMRINIGSLAMSHHASAVLVSPDYVVFKCLEDGCDPDFLDHYRRTHVWEHYVNAVGNGSVRVRIYYSELARMKLRLPPIEHQRAISEVLNDANREIELTKENLAALQRQKRGLMQKLLTGKWRVKTTKEDERGRYESVS